MIAFWFFLCHLFTSQDLDTAFPGVMTPAVPGSPGLPADGCAVDPLLTRDAKRGRKRLRLDFTSGSMQRIESLFSEDICSVGEFGGGHLLRNDRSSSDSVLGRVRVGVCSSVVPAKRSRPRANLLRSPVSLEQRTLDFLLAVPANATAFQVYEYSLKGSRRKSPTLSSMLLVVGAELDVRSALGNPIETDVVEMSAPLGFNCLVGLCHVPADDACPCHRPVKLADPCLVSLCRSPSSGPSPCSDEYGQELPPPYPSRVPADQPGSCRRWAVLSDPYPEVDTDMTGSNLLVSDFVAACPLLSPCGIDGDLLLSEVPPEHSLGQGPAASSALCSDEHLPASPHTRRQLPHWLHQRSPWWPPQPCPGGHSGAFGPPVLSDPGHAVDMGMTGCNLLGGDIVVGCPRLPLCGTDGDLLLGEANHKRSLGRGSNSSDVGMRRRRWRRDVLSGSCKEIDQAASVVPPCVEDGSPSRATSTSIIGFVGVCCASSPCPRSCDDEESGVMTPTLEDLQASAALMDNAINDKDLRVSLVPVFASARSSVDRGDHVFDGLDGNRLEPFDALSDGAMNEGVDVELLVDDHIDHAYECLASDVESEHGVSTCIVGFCGDCGKSLGLQVDIKTEPCVCGGYDDLIGVNLGETEQASSTGDAGCGIANTKNGAILRILDVEQELPDGSELGEANDDEHSTNWSCGVVVGVPVPGGCIECDVSSPVLSPGAASLLPLYMGAEADHIHLMAYDADCRQLSMVSLMSDPA